MARRSHVIVLPRLGGMRGQKRAVGQRQRIPIVPRMIGRRGRISETAGGARRDPIDLNQVGRLVGCAEKRTICPDACELNRAHRWRRRARLSGSSFS